MITSDKDIAEHLAAALKDADIVKQADWARDGDKLAPYEAKEVARLLTPVVRQLLGEAMADQSQSPG